MTANVATMAASDAASRAKPSGETNKALQGGRKTPKVVVFLANGETGKSSFETAFGPPLR